MVDFYKLIETLYYSLPLIDDEETYIVPSDTDVSKLKDRYITYKIITTDIDDLQQEQLEVVDNKRVLHKNSQTTISFNIVSKDQKTALILAESLKDLLTYTLKEYIYTNYNMVILDVTPIKDVTVRLSDTYSYRYNLDIRLRESRTITREVGSIESANIKWRYVK